jgi:5-formyltetrahydrofolate cyclo-ligase
MAPGAALVPGSFGISEPEPDAPELPVSAIDVMIVPGLAFDEQARRLGFGGGYYDGALAGARSAGRPMLIGFAYEFQIVGDVPAGPDDMPVDLVVTDARVIRREARG